MAIVELKWDCTSCDSKGILGRHARCPGCGSPREKGEMGSMGKYLKEAEKKDASQNPALSKELISRGKAGADWFCARCESGNGNRDERCTSCASPREGIAVEDHPNFKGAHKGAKPLERDGYGEVEKSISQPTGGSSSEEKKYNPWPGPHRFPPKSPPPISPSDMAVVSGIGCVPLIPIAALIGGLGLLGYGIWWCFQTSEGRHGSSPLNGYGRWLYRNSSRKRFDPSVLKPRNLIRSCRIREYPLKRVWCS